MSKPIKNRVGIKYGRLLVKEYCGVIGKNNHKWGCVCDCGKYIVVTSNNIASGGTKSCGCIKVEYNRSRLQKSPEHKARKSIFNIYKRNAKLRNINFELNIDQVFELCQKECFYCKIPFSNEVFGFKYNGIDRTDNSIGYVINNVTTCCRTCNQAKNNLSIDQFKEWIKRIYVNFLHIR